MRTLASIPPGEAVLVGDLKIARRGPSRRPILVVEFWDPGARTRRAADVGDFYPAGAVFNISDMGLATTATNQASWLMADPDDWAATRVTLSHFAGHLRAWRSEQRLAGRLTGPARVTVASTVIRRPWP